MTIEHLPTNSLKEHPDNPRVIKTGKFKDLCESIRRNLDYFEARPILANKELVIFAGTMRWRAAQEIGLETVPVVVMDISDERQRELMVRDNVSSGEWDIQKLSLFAEPLLMNAGFTKVQLHNDFALFRETEDDNFDADDAREAIKEPLTKRGEIIQLGRHVLMCGDATSREDMFALMGTQHDADMIFSDPPYNIAYEDAAGRTIENDDMEPQKFEDLLLDAFANAYAFSKPHATIYICHADKTYRQFINAFEQAGWHWHQNVRWLKDKFNLSSTHFHHVSEPIMYGWKKTATPYTNEALKTNTDIWDLDSLDFMERLDVWKVARPKTNERIHSNQKPIKLLEIPMRKSLPHEGIVLDMFARGGSTLIAAEQMGASARLMELDPAYCDVIRLRWQRYQESINNSANQ